MQVHDSLSGLVGNTPLVRLRSVTRGIPGATVLAKVEYFNPGGSVKDRIALRMVAAAEASGALRPGGTIVEPTSGNTGVGLAIVAAERGRFLSGAPINGYAVNGEVFRTFRASRWMRAMCSNSRW